MKLVFFSVLCRILLKWLFVKCGLIGFVLVMVFGLVFIVGLMLVGLFVVGVGVLVVVVLVLCLVLVCVNWVKLYIY